MQIRQSAAEWKDLINRRASLATASLPGMIEKLGVSVQPAVLGGVKAFIVTPKSHPGGEPQPPARACARRRLRLFAPGEAALPEAIMMAGFGGFKVISVDYRMPPDFPVSRGHG